MQIIPGGFAEDAPTTKEPDDTTSAEQLVGRRIMQAFPGHGVHPWEGIVESYCKDKKQFEVFFEEDNSYVTVSYDTVLKNLKSHRTTQPKPEPVVTEPEKESNLMKLRRNPLQEWTVDDVHTWLLEHSALTRYAKTFKNEEIDGSALKFIYDDRDHTALEALGRTMNCYFNALSVSFRYPSNRTSPKTFQ